MMKWLFAGSCLLILGGCTADETAEDTVDATVETVSTESNDTEETNKELDVWNMPRLLDSVYEDENLSIALEREAIDDQNRLTVMIKNTSSEALDLSPDVMILNNDGEEMTRVETVDEDKAEDIAVIDPGEEIEKTFDISAFGLDHPEIKKEHGLLYTVGISVDNTVIPLDFYMGDAVDLVSAMDE